MGLRDRLKSTLKSMLGDPLASDPRPTRSEPPRAAPKAAEPAAKPVAAAAKPVAAAAKPVAAAAKPVAPEKAAEPAPASGSSSEWTDVGASTAVVEGKAASWAYQDGVIAVFRRQGQLYVVDNACRHEDGPVGEGAINGCKVQCPYHDWEYDFTTGECLSNPGNRLTTYRVEEADGRIRVGGVLREGTDERGGEHNDGLKVITR